MNVFVDGVAAHPGLQHKLFETVKNDMGWYNPRLWFSALRPYR